MLALICAWDVLWRSEQRAEGKEAVWGTDRKTMLKQQSVTSVKNFQRTNCSKSRWISFTNLSGRSLCLFKNYRTAVLGGVYCSGLAEGMMRSLLSRLLSPCSSRHEYGRETIQLLPVQDIGSLLTLVPLSSNGIQIAIWQMKLWSAWSHGTQCKLQICSRWSRDQHKPFPCRDTAQMWWRSCGLWFTAWR